MGSLSSSAAACSVRAPARVLEYRISRLRVFASQIHCRKPSLNELTKENTPPLAGVFSLEGPVGLEPTTLCLRGRCSNQLSYGPSSSEPTPWPRFAVCGKSFGLRLCSSSQFSKRSTTLPGLKNWFRTTSSDEPCAVNSRSPFRRTGTFLCLDRQSLAANATQEL